MMKTTAALATTTLLVSGAEIKPKVFIMMGQSNMVGEGFVGGTTNVSLEYAVKTLHKYPYLWNATSSDWAVSDHVQYTFVMGVGNNSFTPNELQHNEFLTVKGKTMGVELGVGHEVGDALKEPVMLLKGCIGNRALGWDLLPPGSTGFDYTDTKNNTYTYAGYHESPARWPKGTKPVPVDWEGGQQYDGDTARMDAVLANVSAYYPGATGYEVAGFFWWQGDRDSRDLALAGRYEENLVTFIKAVRKRYNAPNAPFVTATLGQTVKGDTDGGGLILDAMMNVDGTSGKYPDFKGNVAAVYTHPLSLGGASGSHYGRNAQTYMNVGEAMGQAMVNLLK